MAFIMMMMMVIALVVGMVLQIILNFGGKNVNNLEEIGQEETWE